VSSAYVRSLKCTDPTVMPVFAHICHMIQSMAIQKGTGARIHLLLFGCAVTDNFLLTQVHLYYDGELQPDQPVCADHQCLLMPSIAQHD